MRRPGPHSGDQKNFPRRAEDQDDSPLRTDGGWQACGVALIRESGEIGPWRRDAECGESLGLGQAAG
jgi:hypothetical protein